jgi:radical SAM superfamily enzyme YgiQ (UPF0313 family)
MKPDSNVKSAAKISQLVFRPKTGTAAKQVRQEPARILLCVLPYLVFQPDAPVPGKTVRSFLAFPYGVLTMASYIKSRANPAPVLEILDLNFFATTEERLAELRRQLQQIRPHIVGFSMSYDISYTHVSALAKEVKEFDSQILTVMGGPAVTTAWDEILVEQEHVDALCYSEGERAMLALAESNDFASELKKDPWVTRQSLAEKREPQTVVLENLNEVIHVDYGLLDTKRYSMKEAFSPFVTYRNDGDVRQFFIVTSRGCPFKCVFCAEPSFHGANMRYADVDVIIEHVRHLVDKYGMNVLTIYDDQLLMEKQRAKELFRRLAEFRIRVEMPNGVTLAFIDEELAFLMKQGGVDTIFLAIESGSDYVLKRIIKKPIRLDKAKGIIELLRKNKIFVQSFFIIGFPGETQEHREETRRFITDVGIDWSFFNFATPLRGSELFKICVEKGWIDKKFSGIGRVDMTEYVIRAPGLNPQEITDQIYRMNLEANFVNNHRMKIGDFSTAKRCFEEVLERHPDHPFALYFLAMAQRALGCEAEAAESNLRRYEAIVAADRRWKGLVESFSMPAKIELELT